MKLIGTSIKMSVIHNRTKDLWSSFSPIIGQISDRCGDHKISLQIYERDYFEEFDPTKYFEKWAMVEVSSFKNMPAGFKALEVERSLYAIFEHKGSSADNSIFEYIFGVWLPQSEYIIDQRPHFEILPKDYTINNIEAQESIYIPIKQKGN